MKINIKWIFITRKIAFNKVANYNENDFLSCSGSNEILLQSVGHNHINTNVFCSPSFVSTCV